MKEELQIIAEMLNRLTLSKAEFYGVSSAFKKIESALEDYNKLKEDGNDSEKA